MLSADDQQIRWIYRSINPDDVPHRLIQFQNMQESNAEADWNLDDGSATLKMWQKRTSTGEFPMGLPFFSFANDHENAVTSPDLPTQAEHGDNFIVILEDNASAPTSLAYKQIVLTKCHPRKIRNSGGEEITLKAFVCYKGNSDLLVTGMPFCCIYDNIPQNHRTITLVEGSCINCIDCSIGGHLGAEPITEPSLSEILGLKMHCLRLRAAAEPRPLGPGVDQHIHRLARVLYRGFDTDCSEADSKAIINILHHLNQCDYQLSALKCLKRHDLVELLLNLFASECIDEEETKEVQAVLSWIRRQEFDHPHFQNLSR
jgi:hypothetical protein